MKKQTRLFTVVLTGIMVFTLAISAAAEPKQGGTLIIVTGDNPRHFNPAVQSGTPTGIPGSQIFASPIRFDENWKPQPYLAESWEWSDDGKALTLHLRKDARFHDGKPITSEDVAFSIAVNKANHPFKTKFGAVEKVETPDPHTAVLRLSKSHPALLLALSPCLAPIIPKHIYDDGQDMKTHPRNADPVGSGPFKLKEFKPGEHIILERNDDYFLEGRPYLDRIVFKIVPTISNHVLGLKKGEYHYTTVTALTIRDWKMLDEEDHLVATNDGYEAVGPLNWLAFNTKRKPLDDKIVRQAIAYAIDRDFIVKVLHNGGSLPATGPIVPGSPYYTDQVNHYNLDLDKAKQLLDQAGYPVKDDGVRFSLQCDYYPNYDEMQKLIADYLRPQLKKIGINVKVRASADFGAWAERISNWDFDMTMDNVYNWGDPVIGVHRTYVCENIKKGVIWSNTQQYCNPKVDELVNKAGSELDLEKRKALYTEFQKIVVDEAPIAYINVDPLRTVYNVNMGNPPLTVWGALSPMDETYLKKQ
ncbi:MAG: ABC transporter substrate-binding protein [Desulfobacterales bacterium]|jgi:peptide/nickel transport system substrate-binding protein